MDCFTDAELQTALSRLADFSRILDSVQTDCWTGFKRRLPTDCFWAISFQAMNTQPLIEWIQLGLNLVGYTGPTQVIRTTALCFETGYCLQATTSMDMKEDGMTIGKGMLPNNKCDDMITQVRVFPEWSHGGLRKMHGLKKYQWKGPKRPASADARPLLSAQQDVKLHHRAQKSFS